METILLDGARMTSRSAAHQHLAAQLGFPEWYGRNLDALHDLLTERGEPVCVRLVRREALEAALGGYGIALVETLQDAAEENPALEFVLSD